MDAQVLATPTVAVTVYAGNASGNGIGGAPPAGEASWNPASVPAFPGYADPHKIIVIVDDAAVPTVFTQAPHGLTGGEFVTISGNSEGNYNVEAEVSVVLDAFSFVFAVAAGPSLMGRGGTWVLSDGP